MKKIALFGGSFDPIHSDHLKIIKLAKIKLKVDEIWIIPANQNLLKNRKLTKPKYRIKMIKLAIRKIKYVKINYIELKKNKLSITYNTVNYFKNKYSNYKFYFLIGSDQLLFLNKWENIKKLIKLQTFVIFNRDNYKIEDYILKKFKAIKINFKKNNNLSSTILREGKENKIKYQLKKVNNFINNNLLYSDIRFFNKMSDDRLKHSINTGLISKKIAKIHNLNYKKAFIAGILHDITKEWSFEEHEKYLKKYDYFFLKKEPKNVWHGNTAYLYLKYIFLFKDEKILNSIKWHTVGRPNMTKFEMLIFIADKISYERNYNGIEKLRNLSFNKNNNLENIFKLIFLKHFNNVIKNNNNIGENIKKTFNKWIK